MKIVYLLTRIDRTGMTTHAIDLIEGMIQKGHQVVLITSNVLESEKSELAFIKERLTKSGCTIHYFANLPTSTSFKKYFRYLQMFLFCSKVVKKEAPDIVHCISPYMTIIPWLLRVNYTWTIHINNLSRSIFLKTSPIVIAISTATQWFAQGRFKYQKKNIRTIYHGVHPDFGNRTARLERNRYLKSIGIEEDKIIISSVGSYEKRKGFDILLKAVATLPESLKNNLVLILGGSEKYRGEKDKITSLIKSLSLEHCVKLIPHGDPKPIYDSSSIFVLASRMEGFGLVVIEAMLSGCCTVRANTEGASDQISNGETGFLFESEKVEELSYILADLLLNEDKRKRIAQNGRRYALEHFLQERMIRKTEDVYREITSLEKSTHKKKRNTAASHNSNSTSY